MDANVPTTQKSGKADQIAPTGFRTFRDEVDRMLQALTMPEMNWRFGLANLADDVVGLRVDVAELENEIQITADLPGVKEEEIEVSLDDSVLHIRAEKRTEEKSEEKKWHVVERSYGNFERAIRVPPGIDPENVRARFANGVLTVTLPKPPAGADTNRKIAINSE